MSYYGMGRCAPCEGFRGVQGPGLGAIVMEPLSGGLGAAPGMTMAAGVGAPAAMMIGAGISYGAISGVAGKSWKTAANGALLGAGLIGLLSGIGLMGAAVMAPTPTPNDPVPVIDPGAEGLSGLAAPGVGYAIVGGALLAWGGWRSWKGR